jgi:nucleoid DNA-binding protein
MDDIAQLKKQLDSIVSVLRQRLMNATERKTRAQKEAESSQREIEVISKALEDFKPIQGYYGSRSALAAVMDASKTQPGSNRKVVAEILSNGGAMTNAAIAKIAYDQGKIKSKKGYKGVYSNIATVLSRGKNVFINRSGTWDLRERRIRPTEGPFSLATRLGEEEAVRVTAGKVDA